MRLGTMSFLFLVSEQPITSIAFSVTVSQPTTPSASSTSSPNMLSPPATATSFPLVADTREEDVPPLKCPRDQLLDELDQIVARLPTLDAQAPKAVELEAQLQQSEQEVVILSQEDALLRVQFEEDKAKWVEVQNIVLATADRKVSSSEILNNLEAALNSKNEEVVVVEEEHAWMEERYSNFIEHNKVYNSTIRDLDVNLQAARSERNNLLTEVDQLKEELQRRATSLIVEKTYSMSSMRRKTLEEAREGVIDFDAEIGKACELESTVRRGLPVQPDATDSSGSSSEFSGTEE
ncbi:interactor of constitutive active ROPs 4-like [Nicotiana sylvestris]|uniref:interactor of constitutive active ROPs 4-like n=1 Tax=Nicotiana sylvestris TaxID=4096 RepID=UPI00388C953A